MQHYAARTAASLRNPRAALSQPRAGERPPLMCAYHAHVQALIIADDDTPLCPACAMDAELARAARRGM